MSEISVQLPSDTINYLQWLGYEIAGFEVLHTHALNANIPLETLTEIRHAFQNRYAEYQLAKAEMWKEYASQFPRFKRWWIDFQDGKLHVEVLSDA